jgi:AcrR family transcriptional regulator
VTSEEAPLAPAVEPSDTEPESKGERTRRRLLDLAIDQFGSRGYRATSVSEITRAADLTQAASYAYFDSKEALFRAAVDDDAGALIDEALVEVEATPATELIPALLVHLAAGLAEHPLVARVLGGFEPDAMDQLADLPALRRTVDEVGRRLAEGQEMGVIRPDIDASTIATGIGSILLALLTAMTQGAGQSSDDVIVGVLSVFNATVLPVD